MISLKYFGYKSILFSIVSPIINSLMESYWENFTALKNTNNT